MSKLLRSIDFPGNDETYVISKNEEFKIENTEKTSVFSFENNPDVDCIDEKTPLGIVSEIVPKQEGTPSPEKPAPILNIGSVKLRQNHGNFFDCSRKVDGDTTDGSGVTIVNNNDGSFTINGISTRYPYLLWGYRLPVGTYYVGSDIDVGNLNNIFFLRVYKGELNVDYHIGSTLTITGDETETQMMIQGYKDTDYQNVKVKPFISTVNYWTPFESRSYTATLPPETYGGEVDWEKGMITRAMKKHTLLEDPKYWKLTTTNVGLSRFDYSFTTVSDVKPSTGSSEAKGLTVCSHFKNISDYDSYWKRATGVADTPTGNLQFTMQDNKTLSEWIDWLKAQSSAGTPVQVAYLSNAPEESYSISAAPTAISGTNTLYTDAGPVLSVSGIKGEMNKANLHYLEAHCPQFTSGWGNDGDVGLSDGKGGIKWSRFVDDTLSKPNKAADAKIVGDKLSPIESDIASIKATMDLMLDDTLGVQIDLRNKICTRLGKAKGLNAGADFDKFPMYGERKRCIVNDQKKIVAWYGDPNYTEDGSLGQVMVYQPKIYYRMEPLEKNPITTTNKGYHLRKANYYISSTFKPGFKLHPAFIDEDGKEVEYILVGAYEASIYDSSAGAYLLNDEQVCVESEDKACSISGARPATGGTQGFTRTALEKMAKNRGKGWHSMNIKVASLEQLLMMVEFADLNTQRVVGQGVTQLPWTVEGKDNNVSFAARTGATQTLGNKTGRAEKTLTYPGGEETEYTTDGKVSITYRGVENFWGDLWTFVNGINIWGDGAMDGGMAYICDDFAYAENKKDGNYIPTGFTATPANGYISAFGYSDECDWIFIASECSGDSSNPVGDYTYITTNLNGYRIARLGGDWFSWSYAGAFYWPLTLGVGARNRTIGGRCVCI